ncbi:MAG: hypothetical protein MJZ65_02130 [Paludibacteraceae bacterium]|nr:hypothetical protein [Paludibacteraceae bacterium]
MPLSDIIHPWLNWSTFALLVVLLVTCALQPRMVVNGLSMLASPIQRRYEDASDNMLIRMLQTLFRWGTLSLVATIGIQAYLGGPTIQMSNWGLSAVIIIAVLAVRDLIIGYLQLTFHFAVHIPTCMQHRTNIWHMISLVLTAYLIALPWLSATVQWVTPVVAAGIYLVVLWWKLVNLFGWNIKNICNITLYWLHLEVVPLLAMAGLIRHQLIN